MKLLIYHGVAIVVYLATGQVQKSSDALSHAQAMQLLAKVYDYEEFRELYALEGDKITTRENHEKFLAFIASKYQGAFSESELTDLVSFLTSPTGRKWIRFTKEEQYLQKFLESIEEPKVRPQIWTCAIHGDIRTENPGKCPICGRALIKKTMQRTAPRPVQELEAVSKPRF